MVIFSFRIKINFKKVIFSLSIRFKYFVDCLFLLNLRGGGNRILIFFVLFFGKKKGKRKILEYKFYYECW